MLLLSLLPQCIFFVEEDALLERGEKTLFRQQFPLLPFGKSDHGPVCLLAWVGEKRKYHKREGEGARRASFLPREIPEKNWRERRRGRGVKEKLAAEGEGEREKCASCSVCGGGRRRTGELASFPPLCSVEGGRAVGGVARRERRKITLGALASSREKPSPTQPATGNGKGKTDREEERWSLSLSLSLPTFPPGSASLF